MPVKLLDQAIVSLTFSPNGIKVSPELWRSLVAADRIKWKRGYLESVIDSGIDFPVLDEKIFVHVAPELDDFAYELPKTPNPTVKRDGAKARRPLAPR